MTIFTVGTYDVPDIGHFKLFERYSMLGELTVGVNTDEYIEKYKGRKPVFTYDERVGYLKMCKYISRIIPNSQDDLKPILITQKPDILAIGSDWVDRYYDQIHITQEELDKMGILFLYMPYTKTISTTEIKRRLNAQDNVIASR